MVVSRTFRFVVSARKKSTKPYQGVVTIGFDKLYLIRLIRTLFDVYYLVITPALFTKWTWCLYVKDGHEKKLIKSGSSNIKNSEDLLNLIIIKNI